MPYNNMTNVTDFADLITHVNTATNQMYGHFLVFTIWVIVFMALGNRPREDAFATASFITFIGASLLWGMGAVSGLAIIVSVAALIGSALLLLYRK